MINTFHKNDQDYKLYPDGRFVIRNYNCKKPFSNFLPGIAGLYGTPMWVFYVNRGQGVASFGTKNKDNAILEFYPANKAYQMVTHVGFRTFLKISSKNAQNSPGHASGHRMLYEPFKENGSLSKGAVEQTMIISSDEFCVEEVNSALGLKITARFFTIPGEPLSALARELHIENISNSPVSLELLDGLPQVNPYGMNEFFIKHMSRTIEAWMIAENVQGKKAPFFRLRVDATDRPEVTPIEEGNFYFSVLEERGPKGKLMDPIVDPAKIFGTLMDYSEPKVFYQSEVFKAPPDQIMENKTPCAFSFASFKLASGQSKKAKSYYGHAKSLELLNRYVGRAIHKEYFEEKRLENKRLIERLKSPIFSATSSITYDLYCGQTYLDNVMRGGVPVPLVDEEQDLMFHVYSRKHGDLERDYNRFLVEPTYFSQGDGNYRDVNQNRRNDVWFTPEVRDSNIKTFLDLIQLDGFNPLVIKGVQFYFRKPAEASKVLSQFIGKKNAGLCARFLAQSFTPGEFYRFLEERKFVTKHSFHELIKALAPWLIREELAEHGEGFWVDHWTYNLDLIESYLAIYPEEWERLLFDKKEFTFYDNDHRVNPRDLKYQLKNGNGVRQYKSVVKVGAKAHLIEKREKDKWVVRTHHGQGMIYKTTLFIKLLCLFSNKLASLDAHGVGVEMEADKPSWYDALNGLPGLLGSSLCETFELKRLALFMIQSIEDLEIDLKKDILLPIELHEFIRKLNVNLDKHFKDKSSNKNYAFWDSATVSKEKFRDSTFFGLSGREKKMLLADIKSFLEHGREKIELGIEKAFDPEKKIFPTYFENEVTRYKMGPKHVSVSDKADLSTIRPLEFKQTPLPLFLEGPVHAFKVEKDPLKRRELLRAIRNSGLYDAKLNMYKVNSSLAGVSLEIGRACIFSRGWLENESIWLHMEYKLMLELLKSGMADEFYKDFKNVFIPFQPAERYGRNLMENSSFIVSSAFPDSSLHGTGFVARLSGSTAEFLTIWLVMNVGKKPFILGPDRKLSLRFEPSLPAFLFTKEDSVRNYIDQNGEEVKLKIPKNSLAFMFLGKTIVFYHNPKKLDTFGKQRVSVKKIVLQDSKGGKIEFKGDTVPSPYAGKVRNGFIPRIDIELG